MLDEKGGKNVRKEISLAKIYLGKGKCYNKTTEVE